MDRIRHHQKSLSKKSGCFRVWLRLGKNNKNPTYSVMPGEWRPLPAFDMIYKFDILFKKTLTDGTIKVVTYKNLIEDPNAFGQVENLIGAVGELSLVKDGLEAGMSINSLMHKYRAQLVGTMNAEIFRDSFPMKFYFADDKDVASIRIELKDEYGYVYSSGVRTIKMTEDRSIDLSNSDSFICYVCKNGRFELCDYLGNKIQFSAGYLAFCPAGAKNIVVKTANCTLIEIRHKLVYD